MTSRKFTLFAYATGAAAAIIVLPRIPHALMQLAAQPEAGFWLALAVLVTILPVRGIAGVRTLNASPLPLLTILLLYGTNMALLTAWFVGLATTLASPTKKISSDLERAASNSAKWTLSVLCAGRVMWGSDSGVHITGVAPSAGIVLRLLLAHSVYFITGTVFLSFGLWLRDRTSPLSIWRANFGWVAPMVTWATPLGAYLLAVFYLKGGFILIGILFGTGVVGVLTMRDHVRIKSSFIQLVDALRLARDGNMPHLKGETQHVVDLAMAIGHRMRLPHRNLELLEHAAMLHNVGYIAVDRDTVLKPTLLTDSELSEIREHPESGMRILREVIGMEAVADIVRSHHECPDGTGYPQGLTSKDIPIEAAIIKVAEAFVAMTNRRPHRLKVFSRDEALQEVAKDAGHTLDAAVAYYLFDLMKRPDLAASVAQGFGPPDRQHVKSRLHTPKHKSPVVLPRTSGARRSMVLGSAIVAAAAFGILALVRLGFPPFFGSSAPSSSQSITSSISGSLFFLFLLGLAAIRPVRLPRGAYVSACSAIALAISLAGGPMYAALFGAAAIGWAMVLDPGRALSKTQRSLNGCNGTPGPNERGECQNGLGLAAGHPRIQNGIICSILRSKALESRLSTAAVYGLALALAGSAAWVVYQLGRQTSGALHLSGTAYELIPFVLSVGAFYAVETSLQALLLSVQGLSPQRIWQRNYISIFPEPLTYAVCGYAMLLSNNLLGLWAAIPLFLFPTLWRHLALLRRLELLRTKESLIRSIARAVDEKDRYTGGHSASVVEISVAVAREMGKRETFVEQIEEAAIRHDLGKVSWPNQVLRKPAVLNDKEEEEYKWTHPEVSAEVAARAGSSQLVQSMIRYHHECYDGGGYPHGLRGRAIPFGARILCVADSFDAMVHDRWYRRKRTIENAIEEVKRCSGSQFDPEIVEALMRVLDKTDLERLIEAVELGVGAVSEEIETRHS